MNVINHFHIALILPQTSPLPPQPASVGLGLAFLQSVVDCGLPLGLLPMAPLAACLNPKQAHSQACKCIEQRANRLHFAYINFSNSFGWTVL